MPAKSPFGRDRGRVRDEAPLRNVMRPGGRVARRRGLVVLTAGAVLIAACGGDRPGLTTDRAGGMNVDASSVDADDVTRVTPEACRVAPVDRPAPYPTRFRLHNGGTTDVFLRSGCVGAEFGVSSCAAQFRDQLAIPIVCSGCACEAVSCTPVACGECPAPGAIRVGPGETFAIDWDAVEHADDHNLGGQPCMRDRPLPAARYRFAVRVYGSADDARRDGERREVTADFALPAATDVDVELTATSACDPDVMAAAPTCTAETDRAAPCSLGDRLSFEWQGGLSASLEQSQLDPTALYTHTRRYVDGSGRPASACMAPVPRCSRDARTVTTADVVRAMSRPDVAPAFGADTPVYGNDARASDGSVLVVRRSDGQSLAIGSGCASGAACPRALTEGLRELGRVLTSLERQELDDAACAGRFP